MSKPVNKIQMTHAQLHEAVQTYLNEHVFREAIRVVAVNIVGYGADASVEVTLGGDPEDSNVCAA